jgi:hypothetical protein
MTASRTTDEPLLTLYSLVLLRNPIDSQAGPGRSIVLLPLRDTYAMYERRTSMESSRAELIVPRGAQ